MRTWRAIAIASVSILLLWACDDAPDEAAVEPTEEEPEDTTDDVATGEVEAAEVSLLDAGTEPRETLRLDPEEGMETTATLGFEEEIVAGAEADAGPPQAGTIELRLEVVSVSGGESRIAFTYEEVAIDGQPADAGNPLAGIEGELVLDERSRLIGTTPSAQGLDQLPVALPEEPVGEGAIWEITTPDIFELPATETRRVELVALDGDEYQLEVTATTEGPDEPTPMPGGAQPGTEIMLEDLERDSTGSQRASRSRPFPLESTLTTHTVLVVRLQDEAAGPEAQDPAAEPERQEFREQLTFEQQGG